MRKALYWLFFLVASVALCGVYIAVMMDKPVLSWLFLGFAFLPVIWWFLRDKQKFTPFIIPLFIAFGGAIWGLLISPDLHRALPVFQTFLASSLIYFLIVHFPFRRGLLVSLYFIALGFFFAYIVFGLGQIGQSLHAEALAGSRPLLRWLDIEFLRKLPTLPYPILSAEIPVLYSHGLALLGLSLFFVSASLFLFCRRRGLKILLAVVSLSFLGLIIELNWSSLLTLLNSSSISGRWPLAEEVFGLIKEKPFSGLGLGELSRHIANPHNAYLQLWAELGVLGLIASFTWLVIFCWLAFSVLRSPYKNVWYGSGLGLVLAFLATVFVAMMETSPFGAAVPRNGSWGFVVLPVPLMLGAGLVQIRRILVSNSKK